MTKAQSARDIFFGSWQNWGYSANHKELLVKAFDALINNDVPMAFSNVNPPKGFPFRAGKMTFKTHTPNGVYDSSVEWNKKGWCNFKLNRFE